MAGPTTFATLWGFPYLTQGLGYSTGTGSALMLLLVLGGVAANLAVGQIVGRRPEFGRRWRCSSVAWPSWPG